MSLMMGWQKGEFLSNVLFWGLYNVSVIKRKIIRLHLQIKAALDESASLDQPHYKIRKGLGASSVGDSIRRYHFLLGLSY
jgi:hypothetical protein